VTDPHGSSGNKPATVSILQTAMDLQRSAPCADSCLPRLLLLACLPLTCQDAEAQKKFAGTWEAKFKDKVICTIRLKAGDQISGETAACNINVDANGTCRSQSPPTSRTRLRRFSMRNFMAKTLNFEEKDGDDVPPSSK